jgi:BolA family transcriptional regulator, general stress-responsive regulator
MSQVRPSAKDVTARLRAAFPQGQITVRDDSHLHAGHAGAEGGAGHYHVSIGAPEFAGLRTLAKHRLVYDAVQDWMPHRVHALSIETLPHA